MDRVHLDRRNCFQRKQNPGEEIQRREKIYRETRIKIRRIMRIMR